MLFPLEIIGSTPAKYKKNPHETQPNHHHAHANYNRANECTNQNEYTYCKNLGVYPEFTGISNLKLNYS